MVVQMWTGCVMLYFERNSVANIFRARTDCGCGVQYQTKVMLTGADKDVKIVEGNRLLNYY